MPEYHARNARSDFITIADWAHTYLAENAVPRCSAPPSTVPLVLFYAQRGVLQLPALGRATRGHLHRQRHGR